MIRLHRSRDGREAVRCSDAVSWCRGQDNAEEGMAEDRPLPFDVRCTVCMARPAWGPSERRNGIGTVGHGF